MPTALHSEYVTIGGVHLGNKARLVWDWQELFGSSKRGRDVTIPGQKGVTARDRVVDAHRGLLNLRINGRYNDDNASVNASDQDRVEGAYTQYKVIQAMAEVVTTQTLELVRPAGTSSADVIVLDLAPSGRLNPWVWEFVLDVKLPDGPLVIA